MFQSDRLNQIFDRIKEQEWFIQLKGVYEQLSVEQQTYAKWGSFLGIGFLYFYLIYSTLSSTHTAKNEYYEKQDLIQVINQSGDELRKLKGQNEGFSQASAQNLKGIIQGMTASFGLAPDAVEVSQESQGPAQGLIQEIFLELKLKGFNARTLTQFLFQLEHSSPPMKLKGLSIDTSTEGVLSAQLMASAFIPKEDKNGKK